MSATLVKIHKAKNKDCTNDNLYYGKIKIMKPIPSQGGIIMNITTMKLRINPHTLVKIFINGMTFLIVVLMIFKYFNKKRVKKSKLAFLLLSS